MTLVAESDPLYAVGFDGEFEMKTIAKRSFRGSSTLSPRIERASDQGPWKPTP